MISLVTMFKGLKHIGLHLSTIEAYVISAIIGIFCALLGSYLVSNISYSDERNLEYHFFDVERVFGVLMIFTACAMAFAHGSNDVANAVGPVAAIVSVISSGGEIAQKSAMSAWILLLGAVGIVIGLIMYGRKVIATVGSGITELTPSRGFCCNLAASSTVVLASGTGLPISTTHASRCCTGSRICQRYFGIEPKNDRFNLYVLDYNFGRQEQYWQLFFTICF